MSNAVETLRANFAKVLAKRFPGEGDFADLSIQALVDFAETKDLSCHLTCLPLRTKAAVPVIKEALAAHEVHTIAELKKILFEEYGKKCSVPFLATTLKKVLGASKTPWGYKVLTREQVA